MRAFAFGLTGQTAGSGDPAGVATHDFEDEHLGRGGAHGSHVITGLADGGGHILCYRTETRAAVGDRQVVVHGLGHVNGLDRVTHGFRQLGDLQAGVSGITATVIEEVADVVGLEYLDQPLVLGAVGFNALQFVTAGAEGAGGSVAQGGDVFRRLQAGIDQIFGQRTNDAVAARVDLADLVRMLASSLDNPGGGGVDHCGNPAGLGVEGILDGHAGSMCGG